MFRFVALYAETQLTKEHFETMLANPITNYERVRKKYGADLAFPHTYEKISVLGRKPLN